MLFGSLESRSSRWGREECAIGELHTEYEEAVM